MFLFDIIIYFSRHFDKDKSGKLDHQEFKSCLRALGYDLPMVEEGQVDTEFKAILDIVDPNRSVKFVFMLLVLIKLKPHAVCMYSVNYLI